MIHYNKNLFCFQVKHAEKPLTGNIAGHVAQIRSQDPYITL